MPNVTIHISDVELAALMEQARKENKTPEKMARALLNREPAATRILKHEKKTPHAVSVGIDRISWRRIKASADLIGADPAYFVRGRIADSLFGDGA